MSEDKTPCDCGHESSDAKLCDDCKRLMCPECYEQHRTKQALDADGNELKVQLYEAFCWFCVNCGHLNTIKMLRQDVQDVELTEDEETKLRESLGLEPWESVPDGEELGGSLIHVPFHVTCLHCKLSFGTVMPPALSDDVDLTDPDDNGDTDEDGDFLS